MVDDCYRGYTVDRITILTVFVGKVNGICEREENSSPAIARSNYVFNVVYLFHLVAPILFVLVDIRGHLNLPQP